MNKQKGEISLFLIASIVLLLVVGSGSVYYFNSKKTEEPTLVSEKEVLTSTSTPVVCAQDAKQCPDGSYVGRTGSKCEFSSCPKIIIATTTQKTGGSLGKPNLFIKDIYTTKDQPDYGIGGVEEIALTVCDDGDIPLVNAETGRWDSANVAFKIIIDGVVSDVKEMNSIYYNRCTTDFPKINIDNRSGSYSGLTSGSHQVTIEVDSSLVPTKNNLVKEKREDDNSLTRTMFLDFGSTKPSIVVSQPQMGMIWKEGGSYKIKWESFSGDFDGYQVVVANFVTKTSQGLSSGGKTLLDKNTTELSFLIPDGYVESFKAGSSANQNLSLNEISNNFYVMVYAFKQGTFNGVANGSSKTFTILP